MSVERLPPASLLLVHGAGSGPWVYEGWADEFASVPVLAVDLHEGVGGKSQSAGPGRTFALLHRLRGVQSRRQSIRD